MPILTRNGRSILFIHIPKTGGTSVTWFLLQNGFSLDWFHPDPAALKQVCSPQHRDRIRILDFLNKERRTHDHCFALVRDPLDRLVSEYFQHRRNKDPFSRALGALDFPSSVDQVFKLQEEYPFLCDNHLRPQVDFLLEDTRVFKYENGFKDLFSFLEALGCDLGFVVDQNKFLYSNKGTNRALIDILRKARDRIFRFYERDYAMFYPAPRASET